jgi:phenylacetate-CoA ligase
MKARDVIHHSAGDIYDRLPRPAQTLVLNLFGIRNRARMAAWKEYLAEIAFTERLERTEQVAYVATRLRDILGHAVRTVPRYQPYAHLLKELRDPSADIFSLLGEFPIVTKGEVIADQSAFLSSDPGSSKIVKTKTSGTTGTPFTTWMSVETFTRADALWWRRNAWSGHRPGDWIARLVGDPIVPLAESSPRRPWRISWIDRRIYLSTWHLNPTTAQDYLDVLEQRRPAFIMGYPSSLEILSAFCLESGRSLAWSPRAVWYSSEAMFAHQRELIERVFRAPIVGLYGCAERLVSASQCEEGRFHLSLVDGFAEGQFGVLEAREPAAITTLMNKAMPLIRFQLGDVIEFSPDEPCPCGRTLPTMKPTVARQGDWLETPSGQRVAPAALTLVFKDLPGVRRSQIVQIDDRTLEIHVDADEDAMGPASEILKDRMGKVVSGEMEIRCVRDTELTMNASGKVQFVIRWM